MTIKKILKATYLAYPHLGAGDIDLVLGIALHRSPDYLYRYPEKKLSNDQIKAFNKLLKRHLTGWSIAHLAGNKYFFGLKFLVSKHTLIPRPESELLVNLSLNYLKQHQLKNPKIIDIGTGSGCLILSIAKNYQAPAHYLAVDISSLSLKVARTNARKLALKNKVSFKKSNLLQNIKAQKFDIILANLPYLTKTQLKEASIKKEPKKALYGGKDGLVYYQHLLKQVPNFLAKQYLILLEIDPQQSLAIKKIIKKYLPAAQVNIEKDLAQLERVVVITNN